jgi:hypothetical protein
MSFQAWKELSAEDRLNWDKISEKGKKTILDDSRNKKSSPNKVEHRSINTVTTICFFFTVLEDNDTSLLVKVQELSPHDENLANFMLPEELKVNISNVHNESNQLQRSQGV